MSSGEKTFTLRFRGRDVLVFVDQCPTYADVLALVRTTFSSLQRTPDKDIVILGSGQGCPWYGSVELSERAWRTVCSQLTYATVTLKHGMYPLGLEVYTEVIDYIPSERELLERLGEQREKVVPVPKLEIE